MLTSPFLQELESARNVLIAGVGGGFDIFSGLPLYFELQGKQVHLANLSFSHLSAEPEARLAPAVLTVTATTPPRDGLFPREAPVPVVSRPGSGHRDLLLRAHGCPAAPGGVPCIGRHLGDTVILVDGGTVSLDINDPINEFRLRCAAIRPPIGHSSLNWRPRCAHLG
jgi:hypothetical protein